MVRARTPLALLLAATTTTTAQAVDVPAQAQVIDQKSFNVLGDVPPPTVANSTTVCLPELEILHIVTSSATNPSHYVVVRSQVFIPPGTTKESLAEKPFHIYDAEFLEIIGTNPTLTLLNSSGTNPRFHEAAVWVPTTDDFFFVQNAGDPAAGTGLNKSAVIQRISLSQVTAEVAAERKAPAGKVEVHLVPATPAVINPNGMSSILK